MTDTKLTIRGKLHYDHDAENPNEFDGMFKLVSFNRRHTDFMDPDVLMERVDAGEIEIAFPLSYYEHGRCLWMVGTSTVPDPGGWDTVQYAGALILTDDEAHRDHFLQANEANRLKWAESFADTYTAWRNGDVYGYELTEPQGDCHACNRELPAEYVDSVWGFYSIEDAKENAQYSVNEGVEIEWDEEIGGW